MKQEDIDNEALNHCVIDNGIYNDKYQPYYMNGFKDGAEWRINSVWHDGKEKPPIGKDLLVGVETGTGTTVYVRQTSYYVLQYGCVRWAYIDDFLPKVEN